MKILSSILLVFLLNCSAKAFEWESRTILHRYVYSKALLYEDSLMEMSDEGLSYTISDTLGVIYRNSKIHYDTIGVNMFRSPLIDRWQNVISTPKWPDSTHFSYLYRLSLDDTSFVPDRRYKVDIPWSYKIIAAQPMAGGDEMILYKSNENHPGSHLAARVTPTGEVVWNIEIMSFPRRHEIKEMIGIIADSQDAASFYYYGSRCSDDNYQYFACVMKIDTSGGIVWSREYAWGRPGEVFGMDYTAMHSFTDGTYAVLGTRSDEIRYLHIDAEGDSLGCYDYFRGNEFYDQETVSLGLQHDRLLIALTYEFEEDDLRAGLLYINESGDSLGGYCFQREELGQIDYGPIVQRPDGKVLFWGSGRDERERGTDILYSFYPEGRPEPPDTNNVQEDFASPLGFALYGAYPNPFNSTTTIRFSAGLDAGLKAGLETGATRLRVYDLGGRLVEELEKGKWKRENGSVRSVTWNAEGVPAGEYIVRLESGGKVESKKVVLVR